MESNLARLADEALERLGDRPSLFFEGTWYTSGQLHERAARIAAGLIDRGVRPGDRIVVMMTNCAEVTLVYSAAWRVGAVVTPVIFLLSAPELKHVLADSGATLVVTTPELVPKLKESLDGRSLPVFVVGENFAELEANEPAAIVDRSPDDLAALLYTGGTTGRSKGVALTHANLSHAGASSRKVSHVPGIVRGIGALPLSHSFGLLVTVGGYHTPEPTSSVLQRWFDPGSFLALAAEHHCQTAPVVPSMLVLLLGFPLEDYDLSELRFIYSGAAPLAPSVAEEFERRVPGVRVLEGYGCTETAGILTSSPPLSPRRGTVGRPVPNVELKIVGLAGEEVPTGENGEIIARGPNLMAGYWRSDDALTDGWFHTGDIGHLDADGYLTIVDRMKDLIIRNGYNVYPRDVEDALLEHPAVSMAAVVGRTDPRVGEEVVAFVSLNAGATLTEEELLAYAKERIAANKYPREVHIVDAIPLTSVGKLDRKRLRATVRDDSA